MLAVACGLAVVSGVLDGIGSVQGVSRLVGQSENALGERAHAGIAHRLPGKDPTAKLQHGTLQVGRKEAL